MPAPPGRPCLHCSAATCGSQESIDKMMTLTNELRTLHG